MSKCIKQDELRQENTRLKAVNKRLTRELKETLELIVKMNGLTMRFLHSGE